MWSGTIETIPDGWALCDGTNGTPDLSTRFIRSAVPAYPPGTTGGSNTHIHDFTTDGHSHTLVDGLPIAEGAERSDVVSEEVDTGTTQPGDNEPLYYALAFIMKL